MTRLLNLEARTLSVVSSRNNLMALVGVGAVSAVIFILAWLPVIFIILLLISMQLIGMLAAGAMKEANVVWVTWILTSVSVPWLLGRFVGPTGAAHLSYPMTLQWLPLGPVEWWPIASGALYVNTLLTNVENVFAWTIKLFGGQVPEFLRTQYLGCAIIVIAIADSLLICAAILLLRAVLLLPFWILFGSVSKVRQRFDLTGKSLFPVTAFVLLLLGEGVHVALGLWKYASD